MTDYDYIRSILELRMDGFKDGDYLLIAMPIHQDSPALINKDGVTVGDDSEWHRVPWENIIGTFQKPTDKDLA